MNPHYLPVAERAGWRCEYCRAPEQVFNFAFEVEHIVPRSAGGPDTLDNLALACESCNLYKSVFQSAIDPSDGSESRLLHPRLDFWPDHLSFDSQSHDIIGITPIGRATVERLRLNSAFQKRAREHWLSQGLYP